MSTIFRADTGLTAQALQQATGLSVDNTEALGALTDASLTEADIEAGRFDGAPVSAWIVNWAQPSERLMTFNGTIGEIRRGAGAFRAELRGLTEMLNQPQGMIFQKPCSAVLGDARCGVDMDQPEYRIELPVDEVSLGRILTFDDFPDFEPGWFERGRVTIRSGDGAGLVGLVKSDRVVGASRRMELWQSIQADIAPSALIRVEAGCDKRPETCKAKFGNFINYRGFPFIPGEDWLMAYPSGRTRNDGGAL